MDFEVVPDVCAYQDQASICLKAVNPYGDPVDMGDGEAQAVAFRLLELCGEYDEVESLRIDLHDLSDNKKANVLMASSADAITLHVGVEAKEEIDVTLTKDEARLLGEWLLRSAFVIDHPVGVKVMKVSWS